MFSPRLEIDLDKIAYNTTKLIELYGKKGIDIVGVTKVICGDLDIAKTMVECGMDTLADSRITNIKKMQKAGIEAQFLLLRTPLLSQVEDVIKYADISLNSEPKVLKRLSKIADSLNLIHKVILMIELGDLREGIMPIDLEEIVNVVMNEKSLKLIGIGTNLACLNGIRPDEEKMKYLSSIAEDIENKFGFQLNIISGGNSSNFSWFMSTNNVGCINNLRIGESIFLGTDPLYRRPIPGLYTDAFKFVAEIIETKIKPSVTNGTVCNGAFDQSSYINNIGLIPRAILGTGQQDVLVSGLTPYMDIEIVGFSSDHIIINTKNFDFQVGNNVEFSLNYGALLSAMTSPYVTKFKHTL